MVEDSVINKVSAIAKLDLNEGEKRKFSRDLKEILKAFSSLDKAKTKNVEPVFQPVEVKNVLREDKIEKSLTQEEILSNTKHKERGNFKGPKAV